MHSNPLDQLNELKTQFSSSSAVKILALLKRITRLPIDDVDELIRLHELLLFVRAYPHNASVLRQAEAVLKTFPDRVDSLNQQGTDLSSLEHPELSGIGGISVIDTFSFPIMRWLSQRSPTQLSVYWEWFEDENRIGESWPSFIPLLEEDAFVEANIPFREWLGNARGSRREVPWLVEKFDGLNVPDSLKSERYNSQNLYVEWNYSYRDSRTGLRGPTGKLFFHDAALISRRDVSLKEELNGPSLPLKKLSVTDGKRAVELARLASTVRYRELYGFTHGDPKTVQQVNIGRGVELQIISLPPDKRLPLRAYHAAMIYKNGIPIGYFEGLSFFERMESGFNLYYTFREGETAWLYAQVLRVMRQITGVSAFSLDPYQIGFENEEGIQSGAFWFYRKLGFRSTDRHIQTLTENEETKIANRDNYRTSPATLRRLAKAPMILELNETRSGDWDRFQIRNLGFSVQSLMDRKFGGDANRLRTTATTMFRSELNFGDRFDMNKAFEDMAVVLLLVRGIRNWTRGETELLRRIILAKCSASEGTYLRLLQKHDRLRRALIEQGSN